MKQRPSDMTAMTRLEDAALPSAARKPAQPPNDDDGHLNKMAALGELACGITHDFRNTLQTIMATLELLESRSADPDEVRRLTASALRASERGVGLTARLLQFCRREEVAAQPVSLRPSLEDAAETLARTIKARIKVGVELPSDLWPVMLDPVEFELALINLGLNARDAMPAGGQIQLVARNVTLPVQDRRVSQQPLEPGQADRRGPRLPLPGGDYVAVSVRDTGIGMDDATRVRAIEPFFTTKAAGQGTGLGLASVHSLATQTRGALRLISTVGHGTTAELWFPRAS
ncbi:MAG TPA: ATP-binding protein [Rhodopila sp.]|nr:ATP-binding protein [Rhodopila sp.]